MTVVGIPVGMQCFKFASLSFFPFGKEVRYGGSVGSLLLNIIWLIVSGIPLALEHLAWGCLLCITFAPSKPCVAFFGSNTKKALFDAADYIDNSSFITAVFYAVGV